MISRAASMRPRPRGTVPARCIILLRAAKSATCKSLGKVCGRVDRIARARAAVAVIIIVIDIVGAGLALPRPHARSRCLSRSRECTVGVTSAQHSGNEVPRNVCALVKSGSQSTSRTRPNRDRCDRYRFTREGGGEEDFRRRIVNRFRGVRCVACTAHATRGDGTRVV